MAKLCLNMIVRNERARISRCLASVVPYIDYYVILDTGSTDGTEQEIETFFALHNVKGEIHHAPFENFEQARNAALDAAYKSDGDFDWLLLCDADMQMVVEDKNFKDKLHGKSLCVPQRAGGIAYDNKRFLARAENGWYRGVTHEYLDVAESGRVEGVWFIDHADGSNRADKFERDIQLLKAGIEKEPNNERYWFYLAQSYREAGKKREAADCYLKRSTMGGWDEEVWNAKCNYAHLMKDLGDENAFIRTLLDAYNDRPHRAEPLYDLAKYYREKGQTHNALVMVEAALQIPYPKEDRLFINEWIYHSGLRSEYTVAAFYNPSKRAKAFRVNDDLVLGKDTPDDVRELARSNTFHYLKPLKEHVPSFTPKRLEFTPRRDDNFEPTGYTLMNPSITAHGTQIFTTIRTVNYTITPEGRYAIKGSDGSITDSNPIHTRNYLARLNADLGIETCSEIKEPNHFPEPEYKLVRGFEDMRLFHWRGGLWTSSCVRELNAEGYCEQVLARIGEIGHGYRLESWHRMLPPTRFYEKNWMPVVDGGDLKFMYRIDTLVDIDGQTVKKTPLFAKAEHMSGSSQLVETDFGWIALVHEAREHPDTKQRFYQHRFVQYTDDFRVFRISLPFVFHDRQIEFAAGMAMHPLDHNKLIVSYGVRDCEAWVATMDLTDVWDFFHD